MIAAYEASFRVQSERSERLRELTPAARRRSERLRELRAQALRPLKRLDLNFPFCSLRLFSERGLQASFRVQSERSERLRELTAQALRRRRPRQEDHTGEMKMGAYGGR